MNTRGEIGPTQPDIYDILLFGFVSLSVVSFSAQIAAFMVHTFTNMLENSPVNDK